MVILLTPSGMMVATTTEKENKMRVKPSSSGFNSKGCSTTKLIKPNIIPLYEMRVFCMPCFFIMPNALFFLFVFSA